MKKYLCAVLILFLSVPLFSQSFSDKFNYVDKQHGLGAVIPDTWKIFTEEGNAPDGLKKMFKEKFPPLFTGVRDDVQFVRFNLYPAGKIDLIEFYKVSRQKLEKSGVVFAPARMNSEREVIFLDGELRGVPVKFTFIHHRNYYGSLMFWSTIVSNDKMKDSFREFEDSLYFNNDSKWSTVLKASRGKLIEIDAEGKPKESDTKKDSKNETGVKTPVPVFYTVSGAKNKVYLLGSMHVGEPSLYPLRSDVEEAFARSKILVLEYNIFSKENGAYWNDRLRKLSILSDDKTLDQVISKDEYELLEKKLKQYHSSIEPFKKVKPFFALHSFDTLILRTIGFTPQFGYEKYFLDKAQNHNVIDLETGQFQFDTAYRNADKPLDVGTELSQLAETEKYIVSAVESWRKGDEKALADTISKNEDENEIMLYSRNRTWVEKIRGYLSDDSDYFIIVGYKHLIGDKGVKAMLKNAGYTVQ
jgi:uncharacterized protein